MSSPVKPIPAVDLALLDFIDQVMPETFPGGADMMAPTPGVDPLPAVQAYFYDGNADQLGGEAICDVHFFAETYAQASSLAREFDAKFMGYPHRVSSNGSAVLFDQVGTVSIPTEIPWLEDNSIRRFQATYSVSFRR